MAMIHASPGFPRHGRNRRHSFGVILRVAGRHFHAARAWLLLAAACAPDSFEVAAARGAQTDTNEIRIVAIEGEVKISPNGGVSWILTQTNQVLEPRWLLRTGPDSRVRLRWSSQSILSFGPLSEIEILPPHSTEALSGLHLIRGLLSFFHRDRPGRIRILTKGAAAGVEGTELVMEVDPDQRTTVSVLDGQVRFTNDYGALTLTNGQQAVAEPGQAPQRTPGFIAENILQWCFYYPGVLDLRDLPLTAREQGDLRESLAAYRAGDLLQALAKYPSGRPSGSDAQRVYHAALLLSVGQVQQTETILSTLNPEHSTSRLANGLRQLIAAVKRQRSPSTINYQLSTELLAASYYEQSRALGEGSLRAALALARQAATNSPGFGFAWERVAELEFSFGRTAEALQALNKSLEFAPRNAQALALKGFLMAAQNKSREALNWFNQAIAVDPALGNAWLGRGLCKIRSAPLLVGSTLRSSVPPSALEDLLVAAALEPQRSLLRSYLGKAYAEAGDSSRAGHELELARELDPADPTAWLYGALLKQQENRINEAVSDLEASQERNENQSLFRSQLLLDEDRAVRSASLASIYRDANMPEVSVREAAKAVTYDYANYSAHLFLANSFDVLRDPTRFNLRYETPWFNELLLANLLAPGGVGAISPNISQQEYFRLFERDRLGLATTTDVRSDGQYREIASQFGSVGRLSYSLDLDWQHNDGVRPNNELERTEWYSQLKLQATPQDSFFVLTKYQNYHSGDNFQYFDPSHISYVTNPYTGITTNTAYRPYFTFDEYQTPIALGAYHREWAPGIHTLVLGGRLMNDQQVSDKGVPLYVFSMNPQGQLAGVLSSDFDISYRSQFVTWISEVNQIFQGPRNTLILGGRFQTGEFETQNSLANLYSTLLFPTTNYTVVEPMQRWSIYGYDTWEALPAQLWLTAGLVYDTLDYPANFRQVPISAGQASTSSLGPKGALVWSPSSTVTLRGAYARSLGGVSLDESYRLEPPQLAGFSQSYRTIISESVVGSVSAPTFETIGAALDLKFKSRTYVGLFGEVLTSDVDRLLGIYRFPTPTPERLFYPSTTRQLLHYREYSASLVANQLLSRDWSLGASYKFTRSELDQDLPEVPASAYAYASQYEQSDLQTISLYLLYTHPSGFFARADANWYLQNNLMQTNGVSVSLPGDSFPQVNFTVGWRFRRNFGDISVGLLNLTGTDYTLNPLNPYVELPRERVVAARLRLRF
jgi:tetratricopeptide (TPR) repeat protein